VIIIKVLGIVGSKRKEGNTAGLVRVALEAAKEEGIDTDLIFLGDQEISDCTGCEGCKETYRCVIQDDMQKIYPLLLKADGIILGSPTYFYNVTALAKAFIDRCYCHEIILEDDRSCWVSVNEALGGKYAVSIAVCEQHEEKEMGFASEAMAKPLEALGYRVVENVKAIGFFSKGEVLKDDNMMQQAKQAGKKLAKTLKLRQQIKNNINSHPDLG